MATCPKFGTGWSRFGLVVMVALCVAVSTTGPLTGFGSSVAHAQDRPQTLFQLLFKNRSKPKAAPKPRTETKQRRTGAISNRTATNTPRQIRQPDAVEKLENARKVLVMGDFTAGSAASGLSATYAQTADIVVLDVSSGSSGLVRDDFYDWPTEAAKLIEEHKPAVVVMMVGGNDRQTMRVGSTREEVRSEAWVTEYTSRARRFAETVTGTNTPLVWIGQVSYRFSSMTADMLVFNDIYKGIAQTVPGVTFVDVWDGFVDESGKFVTRGPDVNGQIVALRSGDVNFTRAGARKLGFYAERAIGRILGESGTIPGILTDENLPTLSLAPGADLEAAFDRLRPVAINSPRLDGGDTLLGASVVPTEDAETLGTGPLLPGRVNDFRIELR